MAVKIRMKMMGRKHRPFFRICAVDSRNPRDGRVLEELGTYDPMVRDADARTVLKPERISYWLGVGAQPSDRVKTLIKKYGTSGTHLDEQKAAREKLVLPRKTSEMHVPVYVAPVASEAPAEVAAEAAPAAEAPAEEAGASE